MRALALRERPPPRRAKESCGCSKPQLVRVPALRREPPPPRSRAMRERESTEAKIPKEATHVVVSDGKSRCRPFLRIEKDEEKFAACNMLSERIGEIDDAEKAAQVVQEAIGDEVNEVFGIIVLDMHKRLKGVAEIGRGEPTSVMAPIAATLQMACAAGAHSIILFHIHPSGVEAEPSDADIETTEAFADACKTIEIDLLDHIIIGGDIKNPSYYSFLESGEL